MKLLDALGVSVDSLDAFCRRHSITELSVFGSGARGELRPDSDIDVMVRFLPNARWDLYDFVAMQDELAAMFGRKVDLVEAGTIQNPYRRRNIERDLVVVYAA